MDVMDLFSEEITEWLASNDSTYDVHEGELDRLFVAASQTHESSSVIDHTPLEPNTGTGTSHTLSDSRSSPTFHTPPPTLTSRFALPKSDAEIENARKKGIPQTTQRDTLYCTAIWKSWREYRNATSTVKIPPLCELAPTELAHWLTRFILEVRRKDGSLYTPNSLHHITCGLMRHIRQSGKPQVDFFKDPEFATFRSSLDAEMKRLQAQGIGSKKKQAEVLTEEEEDLLWEKGLLGDSTPQSLLDTMVYCNGLYFALRSGQEHRQLRRKPCQIEVNEHPGQRSYLTYTEDVSKNRPGGLKGRKTSNKTVVHHSNTTNNKRCFVRLFKLYQEKCPADAPAHAFYLRPLTSPTSQCWYAKCALGHNSLSGTVARLCKLGGISGYKTNHSLRATATTRLYQSGVDEQMVMELTGHRSLEGVRSYKRTSNTQREALSDILNRSNTPVRNTPQVSHSQTGHQNDASSSTFVTNSQHQLLTGLSLPSATFSQCTVNFYTGSTTPNASTSKIPQKRKRVLYSDSDSD